MVDPLSALPAAIHAVAPRADAAAWSAALTPVMRSSGITAPSRIAAFLGQIAVESAGFEATIEDLYYTTAERIFETFGHAFATVGGAVQFIGEPEALANRVYANENGNGDEASGDGWTFRGRGLIQITGRANYALFAVAMHMPLDAAVAFAGTNAGAAASACWFWSSRALNAWADTWEITAITRRINPALEGAAERIALANVARAALISGASPEGPADGKATGAMPSSGAANEPCRDAANTASGSGEQAETTDDLNAAELVQLNPTPEPS